MLLATKLIEKKHLMLLMLNSTIKYCWRKKQNWKNDKIIITQQPKSLKVPNIFDIKLVTVKHAKTSCTLSKTIRQDEKVFQVGLGKNSDSPLYSET